MTTARPPRAQRKSYHHGDLPKALVTAAIDLVRETHPEHITLREVSRRVGVNHRAVYRHFTDLTALLAAVAEQGYRQLLLALHDSLSVTRRSPRRRLEALACAYVAFALEHPAHYRIMFGRRLNEDGRFPALEELALNAYQLLDAEIFAGMKSKAFVARPRRELVLGLWSLLHGFVSLTLLRRIKCKRALVETYVPQVIAPFVAGLLSRQ